MAPLQDHLQRLGLTDYARQCEERLNHLKQRAHDCKRRHRTDATKQLLDNVISRIRGNIASLRAWVADISKGRQTNDPEIIKTTETQFEQLQKRIKGVEDALERRLGLHFRDLRVLLLGQKEEASNHVRDALGEIDKTIGLLQNQVKLVLRDSPEQQHRTSQITTTLSKGRKSYDVFVKALKGLSLAERQNVCFGSLQILWLRFPRRHDLEGKVGNADKPGDGLIYSDSEVAEANEVLKEFYEAWSETTVRLHHKMSATLPRAGNLTDMAKICLILRGMKQERLLDCFCASQKADNSLPLSLTALESILNTDDAHHAAVFAAEQYRVVRRTWKDGDHLEISEVEPLPLLFDENYRSGSFGMVQRVRDPFTDAFYAQKEQTSPNARKHLRREIARLKKVRHRHIVQFVKSYQRGTRFGMLLQPAATTDLERLLIRYSRNGWDYERDSRDRRRDQVMLYPIILTAFGCLSRGLAHIHGSNIRHKDIKPANILFEKALPPAHCARFLWADFGLAYDFGNAANSKTVSKSRYSPRYAAPEILAMSHIIVHTKGKRTKEGYPSQDISDDSEASYEEYAEYLESSQPINPGHGRSTDIFSFGCVILEVLSVLVGEGPPMSNTHEFQSLAPFGANIIKMHAWIEKQMTTLKEHHKALRPIFKLSMKMTQTNPKERPIIGAIVKELTAAGSTYFCTQCIEHPEDPVPKWDEAEIQEAKMHHADEGAYGNPVADAEAEQNGIHRIDWPLTESHHDLAASQIEGRSKSLKTSLSSRPRSAMRSLSAGKSGRSRSPPDQRVSFHAMDKVIGSNSNGHT